MTTTLPLEGDLNIYTASQLRQRLAEALAATDDLTLDLSQVGEFDTACAQVLVWLTQEAQRRGKTVRMSVPSPGVSQFVALMGLGRLLPQLEAAHES